MLCVALGEVSEIPKKEIISYPAKLTFSLLLT